MTKLVEECGLVDSKIWCHQYFLCHNDLSRPIRTGWEKAQKKDTDESTKEGPHSVGVWTVKIGIILSSSSKSEFKDYPHIYILN